MHRDEVLTGTKSGESAASCLGCCKDICVLFINHYVQHSYFKGPTLDFSSPVVPGAPLQEEEKRKIGKINSPIHTVDFCVASSLTASFIQHRILPMFRHN